jgi:hypothetical protein
VEAVPHIVLRRPRLPWGVGVKRTITPAFSLMNVALRARRLGGIAQPSRAMVVPTWAREVQYHRFARGQRNTAFAPRGDIARHPKMLAHDDPTIVSSVNLRYLVYPVLTQMSVAHP